MKTKLLLGLIVVLAGAYAAATYHHSRQSEATALAWSQKVSQSSPLLKVSSSDYQRGFLRSTQDITIELAPIPAMDGKAPTITVHNVIYHGPLPNFSGLGIARVEHSLVFDAATASVLAKAFGGASPLSAVTTVDLAGDGRTEIKGAPATYSSGDGGLAWQGLTGTIQFAKDMSSYSGEITAPGAVLTGRDGGALNLKTLSVKMNQARMAGTESLYLGTMNMTVESFSVAKGGKPEFEMKNVAMSSNVTNKTPEFIDMVGRVTAAEVRSTAFSATDAEYAFSASHVHAPSLDKLGKAMRDAQRTAMAAGAPGSPAPNAGLMQAAMMQALTTHGLALLQRDPVFAIERIGFVAKDGETRITGTARLVGVNEADVQNPLGLIMKVQADATIKVSEAIVATFMTDAPRQDKLAELVNLGYVVRENGVLSSRLAFKDGQFTVNGKPFSPVGQTQ
jgi:uncharacterized protein YdgA (DUF945 family)